MLVGMEVAGDGRPDESQNSVRPVKVFATTPQSLGADRSSYLNDVAQVARWSEAAGCSGSLVYTDNGIVDPWLVSQVIIDNTEALCPLVAVQPVYMHPYAVAKMVASLGFLHNRRVYLNMLAGGFKNDLIALGDTTPHDRRYDRLIEYTRIIQLLAAGGAPVSVDGEFYKIDKAALKPALPAELAPGIFVSGSSPAGRRAAAELGATAIHYPEPPDECAPAPGCGPFGVRVGIIAREDDDEAWKVAQQRFPEDRKGQLAHELAMKVSDSFWHKALSERGRANERQTAYWLGPFNNSKSNCPYLVGSYSRIVAELRRYVNAGYETFILDIPPSQEELEHIGVVFRQVAGRLEG